MSRIHISLSLSIAATLLIIVSCTKNNQQKEIMQIAVMRSNKQTAATQQNSENTQITTEDANQQTIEPKPIKHECKIGIIAPLTGEYSSVGRIISDTAVLTASNSKFGDQCVIKIYDIDKLGKDYLKNSEVKRLINDNNNILFGSIFTDTTQKISKIISNDTIFITLSNNPNQQENVINFKIDNNKKLRSLMPLLQNNERKFMALLMPSTSSSYKLDKDFREYAKKNNINIVTSEFYQEGDKTSIASAVHKINRYYASTYNVDASGTILTSNIKKQRAKNLDEIQEIATVGSKTVYIDAIWISSNENDITNIMSEIDKVNLLDKNIDFFTDTIPDKYATSNIAPYIKKLNFIGYNYDYIQSFNEHFNNTLQYKPNYFTYLTYDAISAILYLSSEMNLSESIIQDIELRGILDEFRISHGKTDRRFSIYNLLSSGRFQVTYKAPDFY